jgi:Chalcone isomerase-like
MTASTGAARRARAAGVACLLLGAALAATSSRAAEVPGVVVGAEAMRELGHGQLRWLGFRVYRATLWSADGAPPNAPGARSVALSIDYQHHFSESELLRVTSDEWQRLALADAATRSRWVAALASIWRDVDPGDRVTVVVAASGEARFYDAHSLLGRVSDPAFGPAYLAIWLDPRTAVSALRADLLGREARQ